MADAIAKPMTLGDVLSISKMDSVMILNELNECLIEIVEINSCVCPCMKQLSPELLNRPVIATGINGDEFVIKVAGEEDAE